MSFKHKMFCTSMIGLSVLSGASAYAGDHRVYSCSGTDIPDSGSFMFAYDMESLGNGQFDSATFCVVRPPEESKYYWCDGRYTVTRQLDQNRFSLEIKNHAQDTDAALVFIPKNTLDLNEFDAIIQKFKANSGQIDPEKIHCVEKNVKFADLPIQSKPIPGFAPYYKDSDNLLKVITDKEAKSYCASKKSHIPTAREIANYAAALGAKVMDSQYPNSTDGDPRVQAEIQKMGKAGFYPVYGTVGYFSSKTKVEFYYNRAQYVTDESILYRNDGMPTYFGFDFHPKSFNVMTTTDASYTANGMYESAIVAFDVLTGEFTKDSTSTPGFDLFGLGSSYRFDAVICANNK